jgi:hypothetical protein
LPVYNFRRVAKVSNAPYFPRIPLGDKQALFATAKINNSRQLGEFFAGVLEIVFIVVLLKEMTRGYVAQVATQRLQSPEAPQIPENCHVLGIQVIEKGNGSIKKDVIASSDDQQPVIRGQRAGCNRAVDSSLGYPLLHEAAWEKPLAGHFGRREILLGNEAVDHFLVDIEKLSHFLG